MKFLVVFALAVGIASSSPAGFLQNTPDVQAATLNFIQEYNRLAKLAADAPDIDIYHDDKLQRIDPLPSHQRQQVANPLQGFPFYSFTANLGTSNQFQPHQLNRGFTQVQPVHRAPVQRPVQQVHRAPVHRPAPVQRVHRNPVIIRNPVVVRNIQPVQPIPKWNGPLADTVPAGVNGLPKDVTPTPEVAAARSNHYAILVNAYQRAAASRQQNVLA